MLTIRLRDPEGHYVEEMNDWPTVPRAGEFVDLGSSRYEVTSVIYSIGNGAVPLGQDNNHVILVVKYA